MAEYPALPLWTDALIGDTYHLTPAQFGVYMRMLIVAWRSPNCDLPNDDKYLGKISGDPKSWPRLRETVLGFWTEKDGRLTQKRLTRERDWVATKSASARKSADARWLKENKTKNANASKRICEPHAPIPTPTPIEDSVAKATGADAPLPSKNVDPKKVVYDSGKSLLQAYSIANGTAGGIITKWLKTHDPPAVMAAILLAGERERHDVVEFIGGALKNDGKQRGSKRTVEERRREMLEGMDDAERLDSGLSTATGHHTGRA